MEHSTEVTLVPGKAECQSNSGLKSWDSTAVTLIPGRQMVKQLKLLGVGLSAAATLVPRKARCLSNPHPGETGHCGSKAAERSGTVGTQAYGSNLGPEIVAHWATQAPGGGMQ